MTKAKKTKFLKAIGENKHLERYLELIPEDIQKKLNAEQIATLCAITSASFERGKEWIVEAAPSIKQSFIALPTRIRSLLLSKTSNWITTPATCKHYWKTLAIGAAYRRSA